MGRPANLAIRLVVEGNDRSREEIERTITDLERLDQVASKLSKTLLVGGAIEALALALAPMAAAATAAAAGVGALGAAVVPEFKQIAEASKALTKAQLEQAKGSATAAASMAEANRQLAAMPAATRDTATALTAFQGAYKKWADSLAPETMPLFTQGLNGLREALPALTPLVHAAAAALAPFVADFEHAAKSGAIAAFTSKLADIAGPVLSHLLLALKEFGKGFGNVLLALGKPAEDFSAKLADWGIKFAALTGPTHDNGEGLKKFADIAGQAAASLGPLIEAIGHVLANSGPLVGVTLQLANAFAAMVLAIPTPVLQILLPAILAVTAAIKLFTIATAAAEVVMIALDIAMDANIVGILVVAFAALAAGVLYLWNHCETFREGLKTLWAVVKTGIEIYITPLRLAFDLVRAAVGFLLDKGTEFGKWLGSTLQVPAVLGALKDGFDKIKDAIGFVIDKVADLIGKLKSIGKSAIDWIPGLGYAAPSQLGFGAVGSGARSADNITTLMSASPLSLSITIDGQQLQARISRTVSGAMQRDGARLAAGGWA